MTNEKILDKIKKLKALATSDQPGEAASALAKAQAMMAEHGLSETDLSMAEISHETVKSNVSVSEVKPWEAELVHMVQRAFGVSITVFPNKSTRTDPMMRFVIMGSKGQLEVAKHTFVVLQRSCLKARAKYMSELDHMSRVEKTDAGEAFCHGWMMSVNEMVMDYAGYNFNHAITLYSDKHFGPTETGEAVKNRGGATHALAGMAAGADQKLYRPMDEQGNQLKQLSGV